jgi:hypothetical protein
MKAVSGTLVQEMRRNASRGASVPDLLRLLLERLGREAAYGATLAKYFMVAFDLPLRSVSPIGGWSPDSTGEISDARIQELISPEMMQRRPLWHGSGSADQLGLPADSSALPVESYPAQACRDPLYISGELLRHITAALISAQAYQGPLLISGERQEPSRDGAKDSDYYQEWELVSQ